VDQGDAANLGVEAAGQRVMQHGGRSFSEVDRWTGLQGRFYKKPVKITKPSARGIGKTPRPSTIRAGTIRTSPCGLRTSDSAPCRAGRQPLWLARQVHFLFSSSLPRRRRWTNEGGFRAGLLPLSCTTPPIPPPYIPCFLS